MRRLDDATRKNAPTFSRCVSVAERRGFASLEPPDKQWVSTVYPKGKFARQTFSQFESSPRSIHQSKNPTLKCRVFVSVAERRGFEPPIGFPIHAFQACTLDHSDTSPCFALYTILYMAFLIAVLLLNYSNIF